MSFWLLPWEQSSDSILFISTYGGGYWESIAPAYDWPVKVGVS